MLLICIHISRPLKMRALNSKSQTFWTRINGLSTSCFQLFFLRNVIFLAFDYNKCKILVLLTQSSFLFIWRHVTSDLSFSQEKLLNQSCTLYVGNMSFYTTEEQLYELFGKVGDVKRIIMGLDKFKRTPCGFCFVEYYARQDGENALRWNKLSRNILSYLNYSWLLIDYFIMKVNITKNILFKSSGTSTGRDWTIESSGRTGTRASSRADSSEEEKAEDRSEYQNTY